MIVRHSTAFAGIAREVALADRQPSQLSLERAPALAGVAFGQNG